MFEDPKGEVDPDLVIAPRRDDVHQDHRLIAGLIWNAFRDHLVLENEIPKHDGDLGNPNLFAPLPPSGFAEAFHCRKATLDLPGAPPQ